MQLTRRCARRKLTLRGSFRHAPTIELLESKYALTTTLFLDFGLGIGFDATTSLPNTLLKADGSMPTTSDWLTVAGPGIDGLGTGTDLLFELGQNSTLEIRPLAFDYNNDGSDNQFDTLALADDVVALIERALEPFDIAVVIASATNFEAIAATLAANNLASDGRHDAYVFIADVRSDFAGGVSVGENLGDIGRAANDDLQAQSGNRQDEAALVFIDYILQ